MNLMSIGWAVVDGLFHLIVGIAKTQVPPSPRLLQQIQCRTREQLHSICDTSATREGGRIYSVYC